MSLTWMANQRQKIEDKKVLIEDKLEDRELWLSELGLTEADVLEEEGREFVMVEHTMMDDDDSFEPAYDKVILPDSLQAYA